jgi:hypothetical protein
MPTYDMAIACFDVYFQHLDAVQHIMHVENTRRSIDNVYSQIQSQQTLDPVVLVMILKDLVLMLFQLWVVTVPSLRHILHLRRVADLCGCG